MHMSVKNITARLKLRKTVEKVVPKTTKKHPEVVLQPQEIILFLEFPSKKPHNPPDFRLLTFRPSTRQK